MHPTHPFIEIIHRADHSYTVTYQDLPYDIFNEGDTQELWEQVHAYALEHPDEVAQEGPLPWSPPFTPDLPPAPPTPDELEASFADAVARRLTNFVKERSWDSVVNALAQNGEFATDKTIVQTAYDITWKETITLMPRVREGELTIDQALSLLPLLAWSEPQPVDPNGESLEPE
jgi:hypothetical protein